jgi:hypothetical protein
MRFKSETLCAFVGVGLLSIGAVACGEDKPEFSKQDHIKEIDRLSAKLEESQISLTSGQVEFDQYIEDLPDDCQHAIQPYIQPYGIRADETDVDEAIRVTAEWCGPSNLDAIPVLNDKFGDLVKIESEIEDTEFWIGANLAAIGVEAEE